jgi:hypothetical protein
MTPTEMGEVQPPKSDRMKMHLYQLVKRNEMQG